MMRHATRQAFAALCMAVLAWCAGPLLAHADLQSPLNPNFSSIPGFIAGALRALVIIALPIISLFIVISGFMFVLARGNQEALNKAKTNFLYVILGAGLILGAWVIATLIGGTVTQLTGSS